MKDKSKLIDELVFLVKNINNQKKFILFLIVLLMVFSAVAEIFSIGAIIPFVSILFGSNQSNLPNYITDFFGIQNIQNHKLFITFIFCNLVLLSGLLRVFLIYSITKFSYTSGNQLSLKIFHNILSQQYEYHIKNNSSETISSIAQKINVVISQVILPILTLVSTFILFIFIFIVMNLINYKISLSAFIGFFLIYFIIITLTKNFLGQSSIIISKNFDNQIKILQESMLSIKDIILSNSQKVIIKNFNNTDYKLRKYQGLNQFITSSPRYIVESLTIILIVLLAILFTSYENDFNQIVPVFAALAFSAQKLLPLVQQSYWSYTNIIGSKQSLYDINLLLTLHSSNKNDFYTSIKFNKKIIFDCINYKYNNSSENDILSNLNIKINKGDKIALIGATGEGKTTFINLLMGLLNPIQGHLIVDDIKINNHNLSSWQKKISHVPQNVFLMDGTIKENITFGSKNDINNEKLNKSIKLSCLDGYIESLELGVETKVGENGIQISGGQKQRIGIARALYRNSDILILDEATNALDNKTEEIILNNFFNDLSDKTIIMISHRLVVKKFSNRVFEINNKKINEIS